jgi:predicted MFS family arabinose efflux permease
LWIVAFGCATLSLVFTLASVAVLPSIVREDQLVDANSKLHMTDAALALAGPGLAGFLIQLFTAPKAILADVGSFLMSAWTLGGVGTTDKVAAQVHGKTGFAAIREEIREGLVELIRTPLLRALAISMGVIVVGGAVSSTVSILYLTRTLGFSPFTIGILAAISGLGALVGAAVAGRIATRLTLGHAIVIAGFIEVIAFFMVPFASNSSSPEAVIASSGVLSGFAYSVLSINQISLRQRITPLHLLGRVTAARRFLIFSMAPFGALLGGWLGTVVGLETTLVVAAVITLIGAFIQFASPIRTER